MASKKYALPPFLNGRCTQEAYVRWLGRKATAHVKRDRKRGNTEARRSPYMVAIHAAVVSGEGADFYTGEPLDWERISKYSNEESKARRREYKRELAMLPTVDHVGDGLGPADFQICSWRTNDCKADLSLSELIDFSRLVIAHSESLAPIAASHGSDEVTGVINRVCDQIPNQSNDFVADPGPDEDRLSRLERTGVIRRARRVSIEEILRVPPPAPEPGGDIVVAVFDERWRGR